MPSEDTGRVQQNKTWDLGVKGAGAAGVLCPQALTRC